MDKTPDWANEAMGSEALNRQLRVVTIGAGISGINMAYQIRRFLPNVDHVVYEKNPSVGGTWFENRYTGCACDVPSHIYQYTWAPNAKWSRYYSSAPEILAYLKKVVDDYSLSQYIKLEHTIQHAQWNLENNIWDLEISRSDGSRFTDTCHILVNGGGILNNWKWPIIQGLHDFEGKLMHSAAWDDAYDFKDKTVAVVGTGSSGVQIVATMQPEVANLKVFLRSPIWVTPSIGARFAGPDGTNFAYEESQIKSFNSQGPSYQKYLQDLDHEVTQFTSAFYTDAPEQTFYRSLAIGDMKKRLKGNIKLEEKLIPSFPLGCRRPTPGNGFLEALSAPNVEAYTDPIVKINAEGIFLKSGEVVKVDAIICATGFDVSLKPRFPCVGLEGDLRSQWAQVPEGYMGLAVENMPNYFVSLGPSSPVAHGSLVPVIERISHYIVKAIHHLQTQPGLAYMTPKPEASRDFNIWRREPLKQLVWSATCNSWFKNGDPLASPFAVHPGSRNHYLAMLAHPRWEDYTHHYLDNRFSYLGNGKTAEEVAGIRNQYYLENPESLWNYEWSTLSALHPDAGNAMKQSG